MTLIDILILLYFKVNSSDKESPLTLPQLIYSTAVSRRK